MGDAWKARDKLGWTPTVGFGELVERMVDADLAAEQRNDLRQHRSQGGSR